MSEAAGAALWAPSSRGEAWESQRVLVGGGGIFSEQRNREHKAGGMENRGGAWPLPFFLFVPFQRATQTAELNINRFSLV